MKIKKGLGRGLSALIPDADMAFLSSVARGESDVLAPVPVEPSAAVTPLAEINAPDTPFEIGASAANDTGAATATVGTGAAPQIHWLPLADIATNPYQPRRHFEAAELEELAASIREHGLLQPILVRPLPLDPANPGAPTYGLVAGERRLRAALAAGLAQIPAVVRALSDQGALELAIIENVQRQDISAMDAAHAYQRLTNEFGLTQADVALRVGKSRTAITNTLRLLELPEEARQAIEDGRISEGHGRAILGAPSEGARRALFRSILRDKLSVRDTERLVQSSNAPETGKRRAGRPTDEIFRAMAYKMEKNLGARVHIKGTTRGQISIHFSSLNEFNRLLLILSGEDVSRET